MNIDSSFDSSFERNASQDYLQDPALWRDNLPQPFRMLDQLLQKLVDASWDEIERRELERANPPDHQAAVKTDDVSIIVDIPDPNVLALVGLNGKEYVFIGGVLGIHVLKLASKSEARSIAAQLSCGEVHVMDAREIGGDVGALVVTEGPRNVIKLRAFYNDTLKELGEIEGVSGIQNVMLSSSGSHLIVPHTTEVAEQEPVFSVEVYSLPTDLWIQQLQDNAFQGPYAKHTMLFSLQPPLPLSPTAVDPLHVIKQYDGQNIALIPTGQKHNLTEKYFDARRNGFIARRPDFAQPIQPPKNITSCVVKYLHYWKGRHSANPSLVAILWEGSSQLWLYSLSGKGKAPERVFSQAGTITSIAVSDYSHYLALGLDSGSVVTYNMKTDVLCGVVGSFCAPVTSLLFLPVNNSAPVLAAGSSAGDINIIKYGSSTLPEVTSLTDNHTEKCSSILQINFNHHLPRTITSYDNAGSVVVWNTKQGYALCQLLLPPNYSPVTGKKQFITASEVAMVIGQTTSNTQADAATSKSLFYWSLLSCEPLRKAWLVESTSTGVLEPLAGSPTVTDALLSLIHHPLDKSDLQAQLMSKWDSYNSKIHCIAQYS